jgi:hypothetical protein
VRAIEPELLRYANQYDERKYPPAELARLRGVFGTRESVFEPDILAALVWKYGHTGKANFPAQHRELAARIAKLWADAMLPPQEPMDAFADGVPSSDRRASSPSAFCFILFTRMPYRFSIKTTTGL